MHRRKAVEAALKKRDGAEPYQPRQRRMRPATTSARDRPRPSSSVPTPGPIQGIVRRVAHLLRQR
jgi:hypothetical protein